MSSTNGMAHTKSPGIQRYRATKRPPDLRLDTTGIGLQAATCRAVVPETKLWEDEEEGGCEDAV